ncbi:MAG: thioredoxin fold domain-containing protein [Desulfobacteraceae bacterium]|nr:thioredoxin fold domain-containing protein [Desulfobacteraceae bacterium]
MRWMLVFLVLLMLSFDVSAAEVCTHVDMDWLSRQAPLPGDAKIVFKKDQGSLCEVVLSLGGDLVPFYAGKDFLLVGKLFKNKKFITRDTLNSLADVARKERVKVDEKKALEKAKRKAFFQKNLKVLDDLTLFSFKPGKADTFLYVVTDPNCSHCKKLLPSLEILAMENHLEIKVILFPVLGSKSRNMAVQAICDKVAYKDYGQIQYAKDIPGCSQANILIDKTISFFSRAGLSSVPVVISGDGCWMVEGNDINQIKQHLGLNSQDRADASSVGGCAKDSATQ